MCILAMLMKSWPHTNIYRSMVSQGNKHKQISDRLRDAQSKRRILKAEVDLVNQKRDARITEINTLQLQFEVKEMCLAFSSSTLKFPMNVLFFSFLPLCLP